jgi:plastocyanin
MIRRNDQGEGLVRRWLPIASVGVVALVIAFASASDGSAAAKAVTVVLTATGPSPSVVRMQVLSAAFGGGLEFVNNDAVSHTVLFAHGRCSISVPPGGPERFEHGCGHDFLQFRGSNSYAEDGSFPGKVNVVGFGRSVSLTARTHSIRLGGRVNLHGQLKFDLGPDGSLCTEAFPLRILARQNPNQAFKRVAMFSVRPPKKNLKPTHNGCAYTWQLTVRPGERTTYVVEVNAIARLYEPATSRPFTVLVGR